MTRDNAVISVHNTTEIHSLDNTRLLVTKNRRQNHCRLSFVAIFFSQLCVAFRVPYNDNKSSPIKSSLHLFFRRQLVRNLTGRFSLTMWLEASQNKIFRAVAQLARVFHISDLESMNITQSSGQTDANVPGIVGSQRPKSFPHYLERYSGRLASPLFISTYLVGPADL